MSSFKSYILDNNQRSILQGNDRAKKEKRRTSQNISAHDYMPCDQWMKDRCVVPDPYTRKLKDLAKMFVYRGYFDRVERDTQQKCFCGWKEKGVA